MKIKGAAILSTKNLINTQFGEEGYQKWFDALSEEAKKTYEQTILSSAWYDYQQIYSEPIKVMCDMFYNGDLKGAIDEGYLSAETDLKGIYKIFLKLSSPNFIVARAGQIFPTYINPSKMEVVENINNLARIQVTEVEFMDRILENRILGWAQKAIEASGGKNVKTILTRSMTDGDDVSEIKATWE